MSHYTKIKPQVNQKYEKEFVAAMESVFGDKTVEVHGEAVDLTGYDKAAKKKAHLIVRQADVAKKVGHAWNDIGYERVKEKDVLGYNLHFDPADYPVEMQNAVMQDYTARVAEKTMKARGYTSKQVRQPDGKIKLTFERTVSA